MFKKSEPLKPSVIQFFGNQWAKLVIAGVVFGGLAAIPQVCSASPFCMGIFDGKQMEPIQKAKFMRGLEGINVETFQASLAQGDASALNTWYQQASLKLNPSASSKLSGKLAIESGAPEQQSLGTSYDVATIVKVARGTAAKALRRQIQIQNELGENPDAQTLNTARRQIYLLQFMTEEALVYASRLDPQAPAIVVVKGQSLTPSEKATSGDIMKIPVVPGDVVIQMSANALSSQFISHSQSSPGLASHSALVVDTNGQVIKLEALIEDGVNLREMTNEKTSKEVAQVWVVSLKNPADRKRVGDAAQTFIAENKIPMVGPGRPEVISPLKYDATMNPETMKQGAYYCTTLVEKIYMDSGVSSDQVPFRADQSNWASLSGIEAEVYRTLSITRPRVAAPSDIFVNGMFEVRGTSINVHALVQGRRLHASVDGIFNTLISQPVIKTNLLHELESLPDVNIDKQSMLKILDQALLMARQRSLVSIDELNRAQGMRAKILESLPEHATLRQVVFFFYLNNILQARMLETLGKFEEAQPNHFATAQSLREQAEKALVGELKSAAAVLAIVNTLVPR